METVSCFTFFKATLFHRTCSYSALLNCFRGRWLSWHRKLEVTLVVWKCVECILNVPCMSCMHLHPISTVVLDFVFFVPCLSAFSNCYTNKKAVPIISSLFFIDVFFPQFPCPLIVHRNIQHKMTDCPLSAARTANCGVQPLQHSRVLGPCLAIENIIKLKIKILGVKHY